MTIPCAAKKQHGAHEGAEMGVAFCVVFQKEVAPYGTLGGDGMALAKGCEKLDAIAEANGLRTLGSFLSGDPEEVADMVGMDAEELGLAQEEWFNAKDGLTAVQALIAHLRDHPKAVAKGKEMLSELERVEVELADAVRRKVKFHFAFVP
jgi:hypothetical protein